MSFHSAPAVFVDKIKLNVMDIDRSADFYVNMLGMTLLEKNSREALLSADGSTPLISLETPEEVKGKSAGTAGLYHFALLLPDRADLGRFINHLTERRIPVQGGSDHLVSEAVYFSDPDGNGIEVYRDRAPEEWMWENGNVKMSVDPLDADGIVEEAAGSDWEGMPEGTVMGHIHMHVASLKDSERFYCEGLGFETVCKFGNQALFISTEKYHHHIGLNTWAGEGAPPPPDNSVGISWFEVVYPDDDMRSAALDRLGKLGYEKPEAAASGGYYVKDPSGNKLLLSVRQLV